MRFTCGECNAQYMISDDKVGTKGVRVRCKKCGNIITVRPEPERVLTEPGQQDTQVFGAPDESLPDKITVDQPEEEGKELNVGGEEIGDSLDNFLGGEGEIEDEDLDDEDRPDFDRQATRVFSVDEMQKVQEEREQAEQEAEERQQVSGLYQSAEARDIPAGEEQPADAASPPAEEPSDEELDRVEWYTAVDEQQVGPMSITEIGTRWEQGEFDAETLVWKTGFDDWIPIFEVSELKFLLAEREAPPSEEALGEQEEVDDGECKEAAGWEEDSWGEDEEREAGDAESDQDEEYYGEDDALSAASSAAFDSADVDWKPSAVAELNALAEEELASLKPPPDPEPEEDQLPFGEDMAMSDEGDETGETKETGEMEDGDSSIIGQIAAEEEAAAKRAEEERADEEKQAEEARKKKEEEELAAQEAAHREREEEKRERAAPPPEQVIPPRGGIPKWALGVMGGSGLVIIILLGFIAYKLASGLGEDGVKPAAEPKKPLIAEGVKPQPMTPPKGPATGPATPPSPTPTEAAKTAAVTPSPEPKETAKEEKKAVPQPRRRPPSGKKKGKKKRREKVAEAPREVPPPEEKKLPPRRVKSKGSLLDFEDEAEFDRMAGSSSGGAKKPPPPKPVKKELPPLSNADVLGVMRQHLAEFKACNRKQKEIDPSVKGKMVVDFIVNPNGRVSTVKVVTARFKKAFVATCISKVIRQVNFPKFGGKPKKVSFPFQVN